MVWNVPRPPKFCSSAYVQYNTRKQWSKMFLLLAAISLSPPPLLSWNQYHPGLPLLHFVYGQWSKLNGGKNWEQVQSTLGQWKCSHGSVLSPNIPKPIPLSFLVHRLLPGHWYPGKVGILGEFTFITNNDVPWWICQHRGEWGRCTRTPALTQTWYFEFFGSLRYKWKV